MVAIVIADFTITVYYGEKPRGVRVKVHDNVELLRQAVLREDKKWATTARAKKLKVDDSMLGVCHRFYWAKSPVCAIVRLAPPNIGIGVVSHELCHAAVHIREIENQFEEVSLDGTNDEQFCWVLGDLVRQTVLKLYEKGVWV